MYIIYNIITHLFSSKLKMYITVCVHSEAPLWTVCMQRYVEHALHMLTQGIYVGFKSRLVRVINNTHTHREKKICVYLEWKGMLPPFPNTLNCKLNQPAWTTIYTIFVCSTIRLVQPPFNLINAKQLSNGKENNSLHNFSQQFVVQKI